MLIKPIEPVSNLKMNMRFQNEKRKRESEFENENQKGELKMELWTNGEPPKTNKKTADDWILEELEKNKNKPKEISATSIIIWSFVIFIILGGLFYK